MKCKHEKEGSHHNKHHNKLIPGNTGIITETSFATTGT